MAQLGLHLKFKPVKVLSKAVAPGTRNEVHASIPYGARPLYNQKFIPEVNCSSKSNLLFSL